MWPIALAVSLTGEAPTLQLAWSVNRSGLVHPPDAAAYRAVGGWSRAQYGPPPSFNSRHVGALHNQTVLGNSTHEPAASSLVVPLDRPTRIDRAMLMEDLRFGQRIRRYRLEAREHPSGAWSPVSSGRSVGHKRIDIFERAVVADALRLTVLENQASPVYVSFLGGFAPLAPPGNVLR